MTVSGGKRIPKDIDNDSDSSWVADLGRSMRTHNYCRVGTLLSKHSPPPDDTFISLDDKAIRTLLSRIQSRIRDRTMNVLCIAYKQGPESWLRNVLLIHDGGDWIDEREKEGRMKRKDGVEGVWMLVRKK